MANLPSASGNTQAGVHHATLQSRPAWSIDHAYSIGHTVDDSGRGIVPSLDTEEYPSVDKAVKALNAGTVSCPNGMCVVRSERQKLYFLVVRSDKIHECANVASEVFNIKNAEQPFLGEIDTRASAIRDHKPVLLGAPAAGLKQGLVKASVHERSSVSTEAKDNNAETLQPLRAVNNTGVTVERDAERSSIWKPFRDLFYR